MPYLLMLLQIMKVYGVETYDTDNFFFVWWGGELNIVS